MQPHHVAYLPLTVGAAFSAVAFAQNVHTLTFTGSLEEPTCAAQIAGTANGDTTIDLGTVKTTDFPSSSSAGPFIPFTVMLTGCPAGYQPSVHFYAPRLNRGDNRTYLKNIHTPEDEAAKGLGVAIYHSDQTTRYLIHSTPRGALISNPSEPYVVADKDGNATLTYHVRFERNDSLKPGVFRGQVYYTVHYD